MSANSFWRNTLPPIAQKVVTQRVKIQDFFKGLLGVADSKSV
jgi:hypothetical protein